VVQLFGREVCLEAKRWTNKKMPIQFCSADGEVVDVEGPVLKQCTMVKEKLEDLGIELTEDEIFPVDVNSIVLKKVMEWAEHHKNDPVPTEDEKKPASGNKTDKWDKKYFNGLKEEPGLLFEVILAAKHLEIKGLLDVACKCCQEMIQGKTSEQLRSAFKITNDFTKEEENQIAMENDWCKESK